MADKSWDKLPFEILLSIFQYASLAPIDAYSRLVQPELNYLSTYQTVCRGWSRAAQKLLYQKVQLGRSTAYFVRTITEDAPHLATLVREIKFLSGLVELEDSSICLESIFESCYQTEVIETTSSETGQVVWSWLLMEGTNIKNLKVVREGLLLGRAPNRSLYSLLMLKSRKTLTDLTFDLIERPWTPYDNAGVGYRQIVKRLNEFISLRNLNIPTCKPSTCKIFDKLIDDCSKTVENLQIDNLELLKSEGPLEDITPNFKVKKLKIESFEMDEFSILYLNHKFKALDDLQIGSAKYKPKQKKNKQDLWAPLTQLFLQATNAVISIDTKEFEPDFFVEKCLDILLRTGCDQNHFQVTFEIDHPDATRQENLFPQKVELKKLRSSRDYRCRIDITLFSIKDRDKCLRKFRSWMQLFSPKSICLDGFDPMLTYYDVITNDICGIDDTWICPSQKPLNNLKKKSDIKEFFTKQCNISSWKIFNSILSDDHIETIDVKSMALPNISPADLGVQQNSNTQVLLFRECVLNILIFPELSKRLPALDKLTLDVNSYLISDEHTLQIFMPSTMVEEFSLVAHSHLGDLYNTDHRRSKGMQDITVVENHNLNVAMATGTYTLKIETPSKTLVSSRNKHAETIQSPKKALIRGTKKKYLIWLKFKGLKKFQIGSDEKIDRKAYELF